MSSNKVPVTEQATATTTTTTMSPLLVHYCFDGCPWRLCKKKNNTCVSSHCTILSTTQWRGNAIAKRENHWSGTAKIFQRRRHQTSRVLNVQRDPQSNVLHFKIIKTAKSTRYRDKPRHVLFGQPYQCQQKNKEKETEKKQIWKCGPTHTPQQ